MKEGSPASTGRKRKAGIMGGTFDPIHIGHLILGETAHQQFGLDVVYYMPAGNPPHKQNRKGRADDEQRIEMVRMAIASNPHFDILLDEMNADGYSYTYRTLEKLREKYPENDYYFIIGADSLTDFDTWREPQRIMDNCHMVAATRNHMAAEVFDELLEKRRKQFRGDFLKLDSPNLDVSSNHLRTMIRENISVKYYLPDDVIAYIEEHQIYHGGDST